MKTTVQAVYAVHEGGNSFVAYAMPPPGDDLCRALTGSTEAELVARILAGEFDNIINAGCAGEIKGGTLYDEARTF